ncbi:MAG TPA: efflux RND transporter periplasmic adaptor subunit [Xanthobacteraceae bacterium]|nr:efflux RND transporter periplasmic adaptor subunit [Xanthobacteraceae bacterium]
MRFNRRKAKAAAILIVAFVLLAVGVSIGRYFAESAKLALAATSANATTESAAAPAPTGASGAAPPPQSLVLTDTQLGAIKVETVGEHLFPLEKQAVGSIDFNEEMATQVFTNYQGRIVKLFASVGDWVKKDQLLFTIDSPDLIQAESTLIAAAGVLDLTTRALDRARKLYETRAVAQKDLEQAISDQMTAEGNLRAGRDAVRVFGKTEAEIDRIVAERRVDPILVVPSPIDGRVTARNAAPGLFVQPGNPPAPYTVADISTVWMLANVTEGDVPDYKLGQELKVKVVAYPDREFEGTISTIAAMVDPNSHRVLVRSDVKDPQHLLLPGMYATFVIRTGDPVRSTAVPLDAVVRDGDGTMTVFVTTDRHRFTKRVVKIGLLHEGFRQILDGLRPGELVTTQGAVFLSNILVIGQH